MKTPIVFMGVIATCILLTGEPAYAGKQTSGCDWFPDFLETPAIKKLCEKHDRVYEQKNCTAKSWIFPKHESSACDSANKEVAGGISKESVKEFFRRSLLSTDPQSPEVATPCRSQARQGPICERHSRNYAPAHRACRQRSISGLFWLSSPAIPRGCRLPRSRRLRVDRRLHRSYRHHLPS